MQEFNGFLRPILLREQSGKIMSDARMVRLQIQGGPVMFQCLIGLVLFGQTIRQQMVRGRTCGTRERRAISLLAQLGNAFAQRINGVLHSTALEEG